LAGFNSILVDRPYDAAALSREMPACFADLNLDQVVGAMTAGREAHDLAPFFYTPLRDVGAVRYRQDVLRDLENPAILACVTAFVRGMRRMREQLAQADRGHYRYEKARWFLDGVATYRDTITALALELARLAVDSRGLQGWREYLAAYVESDTFRALADETQQVQDALAGVTYAVRIRGNRVTVSAYDGEPDYSADVERTFAKFQQGAVKDYRAKISAGPSLNHVEAQVLELVARLYPDVFAALDQYCARQRRYLDGTVRAFDREVQFYLAYLDYIAPMKAAGLAFCYPEVSDGSKEICARDTFDLALAAKLVREESPIVRNDFELRDPERVFVVTGPNQGGKTTFARTFGQLHYLASLGYPVPGGAARLFLPDRIFTHFEREEDLALLRGKLDDELVRIHEILGRATSDSVLVMNESFASTTLHDALFLGRRVLDQVIALGALAVYVTFVDELASLGPSVVSMVGSVVPDNPAQRTYKIVRQPANGLAYAAAIAEKYGLTYEALRRRVARRQTSG
jgi:DNA mismatch repair protein MutS